MPRLTRIKPRGRKKAIEVEDFCYKNSQKLTSSQLRNLRDISNDLYGIPLFYMSDIQIVSGHLLLRHQHYIHKIGKLNTI